MKRIEITARSAAAPAALFALLRDATTWPEWSPVERATIEREGDRDGLGEIRRFETGRIVSREEIVEVLPDHRLSYVLLSGLPLADYRADVDLVACETGTIITWKSAFRPGRPGSGWLYKILLHRFLRRVATGLARAAERAEPQRRPVSSSRKAP